MHVTVKVMPPLRPPNSLLARVPPQPPADKIQSFTVPAQETDTFDQLWKLAEQRCVRIYGESFLHDNYFAQLQTAMGADIVVEDVVGTMFNENTPQKDMILVVVRHALDFECSMRKGTILRPKDFRKRTLDPEQERAVKRLKRHDKLYGPPPQSSDPNTPDLHDVQEGTERATNPDHRQDAAASSHPNRPVKEPHRQRRAPPGYRSTELVLVPSSQVQTQSTQAHGSITTATRPTITATSAFGGTPSAVRSSHRPVRAIAVAAGAAKLPGPPTPDSNCRLSSHEPPESAQRPKATPAVGDERPTRTLPAAADADIALTEDDPIQDDENPAEGDQNVAFLNSFGAGEFDDDVISLQNDNVEPNGRVGDQNDSTLRTPLRNDQSTQSTLNAFEILRSSQNVAPDSASKPWSEEEDRILCEGVRKGWRMTKILSTFKLQRTEAAARSRKMTLKKRYPDFSMADADQADASGRDTSLPRPFKKWTDDELTTLTRGYNAGLGNREIWQVFFPTRSDESVLQKIREMEPELSKKINLPADGVDLEGWTVRCSLKLRRALFEGKSAEDARKLWFPGFSDEEIQAKMTAHAHLANQVISSSRGNLQPPSSQVSQLPTVGVVDGGAASLCLARTTTATTRAHVAVEQDIGSSPPEMLSRRDSPIVYEIASTPFDGRQTLTTTSQTLQSPPEVSVSSPETGPSVMVRQSEQQGAQGRTGRAAANGGQTTIDFPRDKGKGVDRPERESTAELDRQYTRVSSSRSASRQQQEQTAQQEDVIAISPSDDDPRTGNVDADNHEHDDLHGLDSEGEHQASSQDQPSPTPPVAETGVSDEPAGDIRDMEQDHEPVCDLAPMEDDEEPQHTPSQPVDLSPTQNLPPSDTTTPVRAESFPPVSSGAITYSSRARLLRRREIEARAVVRAARAAMHGNDDGVQTTDAPDDMDMGAVPQESTVALDVPLDTSAFDAAVSGMNVVVRTSGSPLLAGQSVHTTRPDTAPTARQIPYDGESDSDDSVMGTTSRPRRPRKMHYNKTEQEIWDEAARAGLNGVGTQRKFQELTFRYRFLKALATRNHSERAAIRREKIHWKARIRREDGILSSAKQIRRVTHDGKVVVDGEEIADDEIVRYETNTDYDSSDDDRESDFADDLWDNDEDETGSVEHDRHFSEVDDDGDDTAQDVAANDAENDAEGVAVSGAENDEDDDAVDDEEGEMEGVEVAAHATDIDVTPCARPSDRLQTRSAAATEQHAEAVPAPSESGNSAQTHSISPSPGLALPQRLFVADPSEGILEDGTSSNAKLSHEPQETQDDAIQVKPNSFAQQIVGAAAAERIADQTVVDSTITATVARPTANVSRRRPPAGRSMRLTMDRATSSWQFRERSLVPVHDDRAESQITEELQQSQQDRTTPAMQIERSNTPTLVAGKNEDRTATEEPLAIEASIPEQEVAVAAEPGANVPETPKTEVSKASTTDGPTRESQSASQRDRELMPPPTVKPRTRNDRQGSDSSTPSSHSDSSRGSSRGGRTARRQARRRHNRKLRRSSGGQSSPDAFEEFRGKSFGFVSPIPPPQRREVLTKLPFATDDEDSESVQSSVVGE